MGNRRSYKFLEKRLTYALFAALAGFIAYLIAAGIGLVWLKVLTAIVAILVPVLCLGLLYTTKELLRQRSLWLTTGFAGILLCTVISLICNFPSPSV